MRGMTLLNNWPNAFVDFDRLLNQHVGETVAHPYTEIEETEGAYLVSIDVPGVSKKDINIEVKDNHLIVSGERKFGNKSTAKFHRVVELPTTLDWQKIEATHEDGVLTIALPKAESAKPRQIKISEGKSSFFGKLLSKEQKEASASPENAA